MKIWEGNRKQAEELILELLTFVNSEGIKFTLRSEILVSEIIHSKSSVNLTHFLLIKSMRAFKNGKTHDLKSFELCFFKALGERNKLKASKNANYCVFYPFSVNVTKRKFRLLGSDIVFLGTNSLDYKTLVKGHITRELFGEHTIKYSGGFEKNYFKIEVEGWRVNDVYNKTIDTYELLRGITDFVTVSSKVKIVGGISSRSLIKELSTVFYKCQNAFEYSEFVTLDSVKQETYTFDQQEKVQFENIIKLLVENPKQGSIIETIRDCLIMYNQALLAFRKSDYFLHLWQILERLTCSQSGNTKKVIERAEFYLKFTNLAGTGWKNTLIFLAAQRNSMVHTGRLEELSHELEILRLVCELGIKFLMAENKTLKTQGDLNDFYETSRWLPSKHKRFANLLS